ENAKNSLYLQMNS
nr:immunoglobulin heavy chain junction region [Homo sapiens]